MIQGVTKSGFSFSVDADATNDMELIDYLADDTVPGGLKTSVIVKKVLGEDQRKALYAHLRNEKGRVPADAVEREMEEIFVAMGQQGKNS